MNLVDELHRISTALDQEGVEHAVCGGVAVTIHGATRSTEDLDLVVRAADVERVLEVVRPLGYRFVAVPMTFDRGTAAERRVHRVSRVEGEQVLTLDLVTAKRFEGFLADRVSIDLPQGRVWVVSLDDLAEMKRLAARPQDLADLQKLGLTGEE